MKESDWKVLRRHQPQLLERLCERILQQVAQAATESNKTQHERYLNVYAVIQEQNGVIADLFDDLRRSNAYLRILLMRREGLITDDEWSEFSEEVRTRYSTTL